MAVVIRPLADDDRDLEAMVRADFRAFGVAPDEVVAGVQRIRGGGLELDRFVVADDGGTIVGTGAAYSLELTVPGGALVPMSGVTWISVSATHRRRGVMRSVMESLVEQARGRGEVVCGLLASEGSIYANVGYGRATSWRTVSIDARCVEFTGERPGGSFRFVEPDDVVAVLSPVHDRYRRLRVGELGLTDGWWWSHAVAGRRKPTFVVVWSDDDGVDQAYAVVMINDHWADGMPQQVLEVLYLGATTAEARRAMWQFVCEVDLVTEVRSDAVAIDDPILWELADARQFRTTELGDMLWLRIVDVAGFLSARRYRTADELVLGLRGADPSVAGNWRLVGGPDGAKCEPTSDAPDVVLDASDLASISLGGYSARELAGAGRIEEMTPEGVDRLAELFRWDPAPFCSTNF
jgi:predicted acetyltransferase